MMTAHAVSNPRTSPAAMQGVYLGPAKVSKVGRGKVELTFPDQRVWATLAIAVPYAPVEGDTVLVISQQEQWYVIGVLEGKGTMSIVAPGDLELRAPHGQIRMQSAAGVNLKSDKVNIEADKLTVSAESVVESFKRARRSVAEKYTLVAGNLKAAVKNTLRLSGKRVLQRAEEDVKINGNQIKLG